MNIIVIGSGALGIGLGTSLISQGANVDFYASCKTAKAMRDNGIKRCGLFNEINIESNEFNVYTDYSEIPRNHYDFIFICSKTIANYDISKNLSLNKDIFKKDTKIIIFQNGFGNDEYYLNYFTSKEVFCARVITGFMRPERNVSEITVHTAPVLLGSLQNENVESLKPIAKMINDSGIESDVTDNLANFLWAKMLYNCALNPLGAILGVHYGKLTENQYTVDIMNSIIDEIFMVIKKANYSIEWKSPEEYKKLFYSKLVPDTYYHKSSTFQDIEKRQKTEIDSLNGKVIKIAKEYNVDVPVNQVIYNMIKSIENDFD